MGELQSALDALAADDLHAHVRRRSCWTGSAELRPGPEPARRRAGPHACGSAELAEAAEFDGLKTMRVLAARARPALARPRPGRSCGPGGRWSTLPAVAAAFAAGVVTAEQVARDRAGRRGGERWPRPPRRTSTWPRSTRALAATAATAAAPASWAGWCTTTWRRLDPDGPEPDPTEGRSLTLRQARRRQPRPCRFDLDAVGGEKVQAALESFVQADRPQGDLRTRAQQLADALVQLADNALASGTLPFLRTVKPHVIVIIDARRPGRPGHRPGRGRDRVRRARSPPPGPAGWPATASSAGWSWAPTGCRWTSAGTNGSSPRTCAGPSSCGTGTACSPAATPRPTGATSITVLRLDQRRRDHRWRTRALLCERHHTKVHHGFRVERQPDGRWRTYRPDGTEILIPAPL